MEPDKVKVTVRLDARLVKRAKILGIERNIDLQDLIAEGLELVLKKRSR